MRYTLTLFSFCLLFLTCNREDIEEMTVDTTLPNPIITLGDGDIQIRGRILAENGLPLEDVIISSPGGNTRSDINGNYILPAVEPQPDGAAFIYVFKEGYFEEYRQIYPRIASVNKLDITMNSTFSEEIISGETGGTLETPEGVRLVIPPGAALSAGQPYEGDIRVTIIYEDPTSYSDIEQSGANVPGWANGELVELATFGMARVNLETVRGAGVSFSPDQPASLQMPMPESLARFVDTMNFWQMQEQLWILQGQADIAQGLLIANIFGGGYYNCDIPFPRATICGTLVDENGVALPDQPFALVIDNGAFIFNTRTDQKGQFCVQVARDQVLSIRIPDPCNFDETLFETTIGPFPEGPTQIGNISIDVIPARKPVVVTDCTDGTPITQDKGLIWISGFGGGYPVRTNDAGMANLLLPDCDGNGGSFKVQAVANDQRRTSSLALVNSQDLSTLELEICGEPEGDEFMQMTVSTVNTGDQLADEVSYLLRQGQFGTISHQLWGQNITGTDTTEFFVNFLELAVGDYSVNPDVFRYEAGSRSRFRCVGCINESRLIITEVGPDESYIAGGFTMRAVRRDIDTGVQLETDVIVSAMFHINR